MGRNQNTATAGSLALQEVRFDENALLNGENLDDQKQLFYKNIEKLKIEEEDLKKPIGCNLTIEGWFDFLFDLQDGYSAMFYLNLNREVGQRMYQTYEAKKHVVISEFIHCYVSMNTFYYPKRTKKALRKLGFFYIDVDPRMVNISKEEALKGIHTKIKNGLIPKPSAIVDSGGGYYIIYKIDPVFAGSEKTVKLFNHIESFLVDMLADVGGDSNAKDACRVLRVPGTINHKYSSDTFVKVIEFSEGLIYSFSDFRDLMNQTKGFDLDEWRKLKEKEKQFKAKAQPLTKAEKARQKEMTALWQSEVKRKFSMANVNAARSIDYRKLIVMRGRQMNGFRNTMLWLYGLTQRNMLATKAELELKLRELNDLYSESLTIKEVKDMTDHCWKKMYRLRNATIIKKLKITSAEQKQMKTLIGKEEKYGRRNTKRNADRRNENGLTPRQQAKLDLINQVKALHEQGLNQTQIASELGINQSNVSRYLKS